MSSFPPPLLALFRRFWFVRCERAVRCEQVVRMMCLVWRARAGQCVECVWHPDGAEPEWIVRRLLFAWVVEWRHYRMNEIESERRMMSDDKVGGGLWVYVAYRNTIGFEERLSTRRKPELTQREMMEGEQCDDLQLRGVIRCRRRNKGRTGTGCP